MIPIKSTTRYMLDLLPNWMMMRTHDESIGAQLMDVGGTQLYDIEMLIETILQSGFVQTIEPREDYDLLSIDYLYKLNLTEAITDQDDIYVQVQFYENFEEKAFIPRAKTAYHFYKPGINTYYFDLNEYALYFKIKPHRVTVNGADFYHTDIIKTPIWGPLDEIGLLIGCPRIKNETNDNYKLRLMDVFRSKGNSSRQGLIGYIARSLDVYQHDITINSLHDEDYIKSLINSDGTLSAELKEYIEISNRINSVSLNNYWEIINDIGKGVKYLPILWNKGLVDWDDNYIQNGIGDGDDLLVSAPIVQPAKQDFTYALFAEGLNYPDKKVYPEHNFKFKVYAEGYSYENGYQPEAYKYKVTASEIIPLDFTVRAYKLYSHHYDVNYSGILLAMGNSKLLGHQDNYFATSNILLRPGFYVSNKMKRYFQVSASFKPTRDRHTTPILDDISIDYKIDGMSKRITITKEDITSWNDNKINVGWEQSTWNELNPDVRIRIDTNDSYNTNPNKDDDLELVKGDYRRIYNSRGDWEDGMDHEASLNIRITPSGRGTLKINI